MSVEVGDARARVLPRPRFPDLDGNGNEGGRDSFHTGRGHRQQRGESRALGGKGVPREAEP